MGQNPAFWVFALIIVAFLQRGISMRLVGPSDSRSSHGSLGTFDQDDDGEALVESVGDVFEIDDDLDAGGLDPRSNIEDENLDLTEANESLQSNFAFESNGFNDKFGSHPNHRSLTENDEAMQDSDDSIANVVQPLLEDEDSEDQDVRNVVPAAVVGSGIVGTNAAGNVIKNVVRGVGVKIAAPVVKLGAKVTKAGAKIVGAGIAKAGVLSTLGAKKASIALRKKEKLRQAVERKVLKKTKFAAAAAGKVFKKKAKIVTPIVKKLHQVGAAVNAVPLAAAAGAVPLAAAGAAASSVIPLAAPSAAILAGNLMSPGANEVEVEEDLEVDADDQIDVDVDDQADVDNEELEEVEVVEPEEEEQLFHSRHLKPIVDSLRPVTDAANGVFRAFQPVVDATHVPNVNSIDDISADIGNFLAPGATFIAPAIKLKSRLVAPLVKLKAKAAAPLVKIGAKIATLNKNRIIRPLQEGTSQVAASLQESFHNLEFDNGFVNSARLKKDVGGQVHFNFNLASSNRGGIKTKLHDNDDDPFELDLVDNNIESDDEEVDEDDGSELSNELELEDSGIEQDDEVDEDDRSEQSNEPDVGIDDVNEHHREEHSYYQRRGQSYFRSSKSKSSHYDSNAPVMRYASSDMNLETYPPRSYKGSSDHGSYDGSSDADSYLGSITKDEHYSTERYPQSYKPYSGIVLASDMNLKTYSPLSYDESSDHESYDDSSNADPYLGSITKDGHYSTERYSQSYKPYSGSAPVIRYASSDIDLETYSPRSYKGSSDHESYDGSSDAGSYFGSTMKNGHYSSERYPQPYKPYSGSVYSGSQSGDQRLYKRAIRQPERSNFHNRYRNYGVFQLPMEPDNEDVPENTMMDKDMPEPSMMNMPEPSMMNMPEPSMMNMPEPSMMNMPEPSMMNMPEPSMMDMLEPSSMMDMPVVVDSRQLDIEDDFVDDHGKTMSDVQGVMEDDPEPTKFTGMSDTNIRISLSPPAGPKASCFVQLKNMKTSFCHRVESFSVKVCEKSSSCNKVKDELKRLTQSCKEPSKTQLCSMSVRPSSGCDIYTFKFTRMLDFSSYCKKQMKCVIDKHFCHKNPFSDILKAFGAPPLLS